MKEGLSKKKSEKQLDKALMSDLQVDKEELKKLKKKLLKAEARPERGIETWFRLTSKNLYSRLQIVDTKANILITANSIIISVVLGSLYTRLDQDPHLIYAVGGMILTNVLSIAFATLATIPSKQENVDLEQNTDVKHNLMTFDGFYKMPQKEYAATVMNLVEDGKTLYESMITDIHSLGVILSRKYRLIRISYLVFLYGVILSVLAFGLCHLMF
ncbi:MAG: hypothetical protein ACJA01_003627 [Saprospiraceae bacterium]|jgi:hypothetical protein